MENLLFCGIDVDDKHFNTCVINNDTGEMLHFKCRPNASALVTKLKAVSSLEALRVCYEATFLGYSLYRELRALGVQCEIIATSLIPEIKGNQVKTDRLDCEKLATFYMKGLLTSVHVPEFEDEVDRDLIRSRSFLSKQLSAMRKHTLALCRRVGWNFKADTQNRSYWTEPHIKWLRQKIKQESNERLKWTMTMLLTSMEAQQATIESYNDQIASMAEEPKYKNKSQALLCFKGIQLITAMTIITEIGDIRRFSHPRKLTSYMGFDVREYSSGGKERRFGITKLGNIYLRTAIVECNQMSMKPPQVSYILKQRRTGAPPEAIEIGNRCMKRLYVKGSRLIHAGKNINKVKVACAREMVGFVWEALKKVA